MIPLKTAKNVPKHVFLLRGLFGEFLLATCGNLRELGFGTGQNPLVDEDIADGFGGLGTFADPIFNPFFVDLYG